MFIFLKILKCITLPTLFLLSTEVSNDNWIKNIHINKRFIKCLDLVLDSSMKNHNLIEIIRKSKDYNMILANVNVGIIKSLFMKLIDNLVDDNLLEKHYRDLKENVRSHKEINKMTEYESYVYYKYFYKEG